ncbi:MAG: aldo/keto reductase [Streptosporangiaceae bacterium]
MSFGMFFVGRDLPVHRLGFGTGQLVGKGYWGPRGESEDAVDVLRAAVRRGVDLIDTADNYGPGLAEELVAEALHPYPVGLVIATKGGVVRTAADAWHIDGRPESLRAMCDASLQRLRRDRIDLYQLHRIDPQVPFTDQLGALVELRETGKIRHIGLDSVTFEQLQIALEITEIVSVQNKFNLFDRDSEKVLDLCEQQNIAFLPWFPLGNGRLTRGESEVVNAVGKRHDATPAQVALSWLLHRSSVLLPTPGTGSLEHLDQNLDAGELELSHEDLTRLDAVAAK